jgi:hypothetical protein
VRREREKGEGAEDVKVRKEEGGGKRKIRN